MIVFFAVLLAGASCALSGDKYRDRQKEYIAWDMQVFQPKYHDPHDQALANAAENLRLVVASQTIVEVGVSPRTQGRMLFKCPHCGEEWWFNLYGHEVFGEERLHVCNKEDSHDD